MSLTGIVLVAIMGLGPSKAPEVNLYVSRNVAPAEKVRLVVSTKNQPGVDLSMWRLDAVAWLSQPEKQQKRPAASGKALKSMSIRVAGPNEKPTAGDSYYSRQVNLPPMAPGVYLIATKEPVKGQNWAVVVVTQLAIVSKRSSRHGLAWVTDFKTGLPVSGAEVSLHDKSGSRVLQTRTKADGVAFFERKAGNETVIVRRGQDYAGIPSIGENLDGRLVAHFQTDRPIYRPGQRVFFKATLRYSEGHRYALRPGEKVRVSVNDSKDTLLDQLDLTASSMGTVEGKCDLPAEGATGAYSLVLQAGKQTQYHSFTVAAYRKPEFKVDVKPATLRALAGEAIKFQIDANTYFGAAVGQAQVRYTIRRSPLGLSTPSDEEGYYSGDGNLYPRDTYSDDAVVADSSGFTDLAGKLIVEAKTDPAAPDSTYRIECTVTDGSRRQVSGSGAMPVYAANLRIGLRSDVMWTPLGRLIPVVVKVADLDGRPRAARVTLRLMEDVYQPKTEKFVSLERARSEVPVQTLGSATVNLPAKAMGSLRIEATAPDGTGRTAKATMWTYVVGPFEPKDPQEEAPQVGIRLDKRAYSIGAPVSAMVTTNRPYGRKAAYRASPVLVVLEGQEIYGYRVFTSKARSNAYDFKATDAHAPNSFLSADQWVDGGLVSANVAVPVPDPSRKIAVTVAADKAEYQPGDQATYRIRTADSKGRPISAEVAFSVVDEAIYAMAGDNTADAYRLYWGWRDNRVTTYSAAPEEFSGGAYQRVNTVAPVRQRFEDTAFWKANVRTGADGEATVSLEMPGNLTTWRATARAIDGDTRAGWTKGTVRATRPVTLRLATPRQMVEGDRLTLIATVNNRTSQRREFDVSIRGLGTPSKRLVVDGDSEGRVEFALAADSTSFDLTAEAVDVATKKAEFSDALRVSVRVVPNAIPERAVVSKRVTGSGTLTLQIPPHAVPGVGKTSLRLYPGIGSMVSQLGDQIQMAQRYGTAVAIAQVEIASGKAIPQQSELREPLAMLSRTFSGTGWGWWEGGRVDPYLTAATLRALASAKAAKLKVPDSLFSSARDGTRYLYEQTNLWDHRGVLAGALLESGDVKGKAYVAEVQERGQNLSPFSRLMVARALRRTGGSPDAWIADVAKDLSEGPVESFLPVGDGIGWQATEIETNAALLEQLDGPQADKVAEWLSARLRGGWILDDAWAVIGLRAFLARHPERAGGEIPKVSFGGRTLPANPSALRDHWVVDIPGVLVQPGDNEMLIESAGTVRAVLESTYYVPTAQENHVGVRVLRRYEVKSAAGAWKETTGEVAAGESVRCTVVVWGDAVPDAIRIIEPLPAGFEYLDDEFMGTSGRQEVRDGAVVHYVMAGGEPLVFRYYIRAESEGRLTAVPAVAEVLRRPGRKGNSTPLKIEVKKRGG